MNQKYYAAIDLKSFYASVECVERGLDPLKTCLVVADPSRTEKTICLAVTPALKSYGISGRARLFEVVPRVREINFERRCIYGKRLVGKSSNMDELSREPSLALDYVIAPPRMALYMEYSAKIYNIYLKYVSEADIHVYSIDEVFIDLTGYLKSYRLTPRELVSRIITDVYESTGITATAGIGTNMYLCKVAMDIVAKRTSPDNKGVRIAELDEDSYRRMLWEHQPLTDFWRIGEGYRRKLNSHGIFTMGDVARASLYNEKLLYKLFGVNAELLIDHAWGWEPCTIADIKNYRPRASSISSGQVLSCPYEFKKARIVLREMADLLSLDLVEKGVATRQIVLNIGYDTENLTAEGFSGEVSTDFYGRAVPKSAHGSINFENYTSSTNEITEGADRLFLRIVNPSLTVRRINITAADLKSESIRQSGREGEQIDMFEDVASTESERARREAIYQREKNKQKALINIKHRFGKNAILKGLNFEDGATAIERGSQIGGHKA